MGEMEERTPAGTPVGVCLAEMGDRTRETLKLLLQTKAPSVLEVVGDSDAEVAIVDIVGPASNERLAELRRRHPGRPIVGLALDPDAARDLDAHVLKPVKVEQLVGAVLAVRPVAVPATTPAERTRGLEPSSTADPPSRHADEARPRREPRPARASGSVTRAASSIRPRVEIARTAPVGHASAGPPRDPSETMLPLVVEAVGSCIAGGAPVQLEHPVGVIGFDPETRSAYTTLGTRQLRSLARGSAADAWTVRTGGRVDRDAGTRWTFEQLLWALGVWVCGHQLPPGYTHDQQVRLIRWPDLTRVLPLRHDAAIAATWTRQTLSVAEVTKRLRIDHEDVVLFLSAAHWAGLVVTGEAADTGRGPDQPSEPDRRRRGRARFLSAVLKRLRA